MVASFAADVADVADWSCRPVAQMRNARAWFTLTGLRDGTAVAIGGSRDLQAGDLVQEIERYDPLRDVWEPVADVMAPRMAHTATLLADGRILVVGDAMPHLGSPAELVDVASGTARPAAPPVLPRYGHAAVLLPDGRVLVAGGLGGPPRPGVDAPDIEIYDPATDTWSAAGSMCVPRYRFTASLLPDGRVLLAGGEHGTCPSEIFDPRSGRSAAVPAPSPASGSLAAHRGPVGV